MKRTILIVEDSTTTRAVVKVYLTGHDFIFLEAATGAIGLELARIHHPDAILVDLKMPGIDGFTFCRAVRADPALKRTPIILVTGSKEDSVRSEAINAGASAFMTKPIDGPGLAARLMPLLGGG
jgi:CheY-like chemotaxis protein